MEIPELPLPSPYSIQHRLLQKLEQQRSEEAIPIPTQGSKGFQELYFQTDWAMRQLDAACQLYETSPFPARRVLLPSLVPVALLLLKARDQWAFEHVYRSPLYKELGFDTKLRQLPTLDQLSALLKSKAEAGEALLASLQGLSDAALGLEDFHRFRDCLVQQELPTEDPKQAGSLFSQNAVDYLALTQSALSGWQQLKALISA